MDPNWKPENQKHKERADREKQCHHHFCFFSAKQRIRIRGHVSLYDNRKCYVFHHAFTDEVEIMPDNKKRVWYDNLFSPGNLSWFESNTWAEIAARSQPQFLSRVPRCTVSLTQGSHFPREKGLLTQDENWLATHSCMKSSWQIASEKSIDNPRNWKQTKNMGRGTRSEILNASRNYLLAANFPKLSYTRRVWESVRAEDDAQFLKNTLSEMNENLRWMWEIVKGKKQRQDFTSFSCRLTSGYYHPTFFAPSRFSLVSDDEYSIIDKGYANKQEFLFGSFSSWMAERSGYQQTQTVEGDVNKNKSLLESSDLMFAPLCWRIFSDRISPSVAISMGQIGGTPFKMYCRSVILSVFIRYE